MLGNYDINWISGDTNTLELNYVDSEETPIDLTGYTVMMGLKNKPTDNVTVIPQKQAVLLDASNGHLRFTFEPDETIGLVPMKTRVAFYYDVELTSPVGVVTTILQGRVNLQRSITNQDK